jgi:type I restriction enzyme S subunit
MEVKTGHKQTEVGLIPEDWGVVNLECAAGIIDPQPDHRTPPECAGGDPYIGISDFLDDYIINWDESRKIIPTAVDKQRSRFQVRSGDIIFGKIGTIGMPKFVPASHIRYGLSANVLLLQPKVVPFFLMAWLRSDTFQRAVNSELHSTSQAAFGINKMRRMLIPAPPEPEQRAIAEALGDVDGLLGGLDRLIAKKRDLKQASMQQLLTGRTRLRGFHGEWEVLSFKELFNISAGGDLNPKLSSSEQDEVYRFPIYSNALIDCGLFGYCSYADHPANSITITARGTLGIATYRDHEYTAIGRVLVLESKRQTAGQFFAEFINSQVKFAIESTGVPQLTAPQLSNYNLSVPTYLEQTAIAEVLSDMDAELKALEQRRRKTRALKQAMTQELLTGKTRLL